MIPFAEGSNGAVIVGVFFIHAVDEDDERFFGFQAHGDRLFCADAHAIVGHSGEGKTTLTEAILFNSGAIERMGFAAAGTTVSDFDEQKIASSPLSSSKKTTKFGGFFLYFNTK